RDKISLFVEIKYINNIEKELKFVVDCYDTVAFKQNLLSCEVSPSYVYMILGKSELLTHKAKGCYRLNYSCFIRLPYRLALAE
ncbi:unnamed protein product, partial [Rotaria sp. Silwood2]